MGLFDKFKKNKDSENSAQETTEEVIESSAEGTDEQEPVTEPEKDNSTESTDSAQASENSDNSDSKAKESEKKPEFNRFTFVVEEVFPLEGKWGTTVTGNAHGKVSVGDEVYILSPVGNTFFKTKVSGIEVGDLPAKTAENQSASLRFADLKEDTKIPKYCVISNIPPQQKLDINTAVENPFLLGFIAAYNKLSKDKNFLNLLIFHIVHANLLAPIYTDSEPVNRGDGKTGFKPGTKIKFLSVSNPHNKGTHAFPVFTHWGAVGKWSNIFDENHPPRTMILRFPECVDIISKSENNDGIVINPFGPATLHLSKQLVNGIVKSEGYQKEFGKKNK